MNNKIYPQTPLRRSLLGAFMLLALLISAPAMSAKMTYKLNDTLRTGFNALDHVLQKPLGSPRFEHKRFGDHFFMNGGVGASLAPYSGVKPGARLEYSFGDWVTPVHGWRLNFNVGAHSVLRGNAYPFFGAVSADYLLNFTTLQRGYRSNRCFELIGGLGLEYQRVHSENGWGNEVGVRAALQARINLPSALYLYVEPRLTLLAGTRYLGVPDTYRRFRTDLGLNIGLGYRLLRGEERALGATPFINVDESHLFFGGGAGIASFVRGINRSTLGPVGQFYIGKWLSSVAALRLKGQIGRYEIPSDPHRRYIGIGSLDYVWNITSAFSGYRPNEVFGLNLNLGVALGYPDNATGKVYAGVEGGLTASFRLSPNWSLYLEPQVQVFTRSFADAAGKSRVISPMVSAIAGVQYTIGNFAHNFPQSYADYAAANNYFLTISGAPSWRQRGSYGLGFAASAGFGKRFTPISSWRLTADGEIFRNTPRYGSLALSADYLFSISTSMAGFNPDRLFDLSGVLGVSGGFAHYKSAINPILGLKAGLHGAFRLNDALDLFIEPQAVAYYTKSHGFNPGLRLMAGLTYRLGREASFGSDAINASPLSGRRNFVSLAGGPTFFSSNIGLRKVNGAFDVSVGRWFTLVSALRAGITYDFIPDSNPRRELNMGLIHADYLLNVTSLITRNPDRRFHIIGHIGGGLGFSGSDGAKPGLMLETGMQFRYNLPANIDIHIEPNASFIMNRVLPNYASATRFVAMTRLLAGASYRF